MNHTAIHSDLEVFDDECPETDYGNSTHDQMQDGEFDWSTKKQGWILSSFFYGYVITQVKLDVMKNLVPSLKVNRFLSLTLT